MSFLTQSHQIFFGRPVWLIPSTSHVIILTQSLPFFVHHVWTISINSLWSSNWPRSSLWNTLPVHLKNRNLTLTTFIRHLKSYLFSQYWFRIERVWGVITQTHYINSLLLTYLLSSWQRCKQSSQDTARDYRLWDTWIHQCGSAAFVFWVILIEKQLWLIRN